VNDALVTNKGTVTPAGNVIDPKSVPVLSFNAEKVIAAFATVKPAYAPAILAVAFTADGFTGIVAMFLFFK
jgi:hypothetical protein